MVEANVADVEEAVAVVMAKSGVVVPPSMGRTRPETCVVAAAASEVTEAEVDIEEIAAAGFVGIVEAAASAVIVVVVESSVVVAVVFEVVVVTSSLAKLRLTGIISSLRHVGKLDSLIVYSTNTVPAPDPRITQLEDKLVKDMSLTTSMTKLSVSRTAPVIPIRPAYGTKGKEVILWANSFQLHIKTTTLHKYALEVTEIPYEGASSRASVPKPKGRKLQSIIQGALDHVGPAVPIVSEYKSSFVSTQPLQLPDDKTLQIPYTDEGRDSTYKIIFHGPIDIRVGDLLTYLSTMQNSPTSFPVHEDVIDALGVVLGHRSRAHEDMASLGSSRHFPLRIPSETSSLGWPEYTKILRGYFQSVRPATGRVLLNTNVSHGVFKFSGPIPTLMREYDLNSEDSLHKLSKAIEGTRCKVQVLLDRTVADSKSPKKAKSGSSKGPAKPAGVARIRETAIRGLAAPNDASVSNGPRVPRLGARPGDVKFTMNSPAPAGFEAGRQYTVAQYYQTRYGRQVDPNLPVINTGTKLRAMYIPAELVEIIPGQALRRRTTPDETRAMIEFSCRSPFANATSIVTTGRSCLGLDNNPILDKFGIVVDKSLVTVKGRELPAPQVIYTSLKNPKLTQKPRVSEGSWNMRDVKVVKPGKPINVWNWVYIVSDNRPYPQQESEAAVKAMVNFWRSMGIAIPGNAPAGGCKIDIPRGASAIQCVDQVFARFPKNAEFVFVILPDTGTEIYNAVKTCADTRYGFHTVAVVRSNLLKDRREQFFANVGLKVNMKAGGINHKLEAGVTLIKDGRTMVIGYDVTHPTNMSGDSENVPSMVGMVSSIDAELAQWPGTAWAQAGRVEMLDSNLEAKFEERIRLWQKHNPKSMLENIVIYRDGVSEGQFFQVLESELPLIRKACQKLCKQQPKIALLVSVKRHQTRFYPTDPKNMTNSRNIKNGTVVDRGVTVAIVWDFFLTAHTALQGKSFPTAIQLI